MSETAAASKGWIDLLSQGRLPRFALICLGVWLNAADALVTATIMPSVGAELGGYGYFSWATAGFLVGAILAGASAGRLSEIFGLRNATAVAGLIYGLGCLMSAAAPDIQVFLIGRLLQGAGGGWISGFSMVAIALLFPERHLAKVFAAVSGVWGIATVLGPLFGGIFAGSGDWRMVFWLFAGQAVAFSAAAVWMLRTDNQAQEGLGVPWRQLGVLTLGVGAIAVADVTQGWLAATGLVTAGLLLLALVLWVDARARVRLMPHRAGDLRTVVGSGYAAMFALTAASMGLSVYGPAILQELRGLTPLWAGYVIAAEALGWTVCALLVADTSELWDGRWVRFGSVCVIASLVILTWAMKGQALAWVIAGSALLGAGFGFFWSFMSRRVMAALADEDRAIGASAITAVRQTGAAAGAAIAGATANVVGFGTGLTVASAQSAAVWVFATAIPLAVVGTWAAFRLTGSARKA